MSEDDQPKDLVLAENPYLPVVSQYGTAETALDALMALEERMPFLAMQGPEVTAAYFKPIGLDVRTPEDMALLQEALSEQISQLADGVALPALGDATQRISAVRERARQTSTLDDLFERQVYETYKIVSQLALNTRLSTESIFPGEDHTVAVQWCRGKVVKIDAPWDTQYVYHKRTVGVDVQPRRYLWDIRTTTIDADPTTLVLGDTVTWDYMEVQGRATGTVARIDREHLQRHTQGHELPRMLAFWKKRIASGHPDSDEHMRTIKLLIHLPRMLSGIAGPAMKNILALDELAEDF